jgi:phenylalanyl-tRNA synthetase beta chain
MFGYSTDKLLQVANPIIAEQKYMRPALLPGIRGNLADNSRYFTDFRLFEIGRAYSKSADGTPKERTHLMAAIYGRETSGANLLEMKRVVQYVALGAKIVPAQAHGKIMHPERAAHIEVAGQHVGDLYELHPGLLDRGRAAILDLDLDALQALPSQRAPYRPLRRFPTSSFDLSIVAGSHVLVATLDEKLRQSAGDSLVSLQFLLIFPLPPDKKSVSFRLTLGADDRTLTAEEVTRTREKVVEGIRAAGYELRE